MLVLGTGPEQVVGARAEKPRRRRPGAKRHRCTSSSIASPRVAGSRSKIEVPESRVDPDAVLPRGNAVFLELDDAALSVQQETLLTVSGDGAIMAPKGGSLLALSRREGGTAGRLGLARATTGPPSCAAAPPGSRSPTSCVTDPGGAIALALRSAAARCRCSASTSPTPGCAPSRPPARHRPVKTPDRTYIALEPFRANTGETVQLARHSMQRRSCRARHSTPSSRSRRD